MRLRLHTANVLKTREKPTTDFVFDFSQNMEGQKRQISSWQKVCQNYTMEGVSKVASGTPRRSNLGFQPALFEFWHTLTQVTLYQMFFMFIAVYILRGHIVPLLYI